MAVDLPGFDVTTDKPSVTIKSAGQSVPVTFTFTRTSAPLAEFAKGFVTLTGPTTVRMPVALRPVAVKAPASVAGTGADGSAQIDITAGFTGDLDVKPSGLAKATTVQQSIAVGAVDFKRDVTITDGTKVARFVADATNNAADLDLFVYRYNAAGTALEALVGQSATGSADETVTLVAPMARKYQVVIDGYAAAPGETAVATTYDEYLVDASATLGNFRAEPDPVPVTQGQSTSYNAAWTGLTTGRYLGMMEYTGALSPTYVTVSVP